MADPTKIVARNTKNYRVDVNTGTHTVVLDEPSSAGGTDAGPDPYDLLVAALGGCTSITLRMYAERKQWPLEDVTVELRHSRSHAADERECEDRPVRLDQIDVSITLDGPLTAEQRARLLEIASRCPLHHTLTAGLRINITEQAAL
jgi:putative redox protein